MRASHLIATVGVCVLAALSPRSAAAQAPALNLPIQNIQASSIVTPGNNSSFRITLSGVPAGSDITNTTYEGWCMDPDGHVTQGISVRAWSSYDPALPQNAKPIGAATWNQINYLVNHKKGTSGQIPATVTDVQLVINKLILDGFYTIPPSFPNALALYTDVTTN